LAHKAIKDRGFNPAVLPESNQKKHESKIINPINAGTRLRVFVE
jgi:hypothetical protein